MLRKFVLGALNVEVEAEQLAGRLGRAGDAELEIVEAELGVLEGVGFPGQVGLHVGGEAELDAVEVGMPAKTTLTVSASARVWMATWLWLKSPVSDWL